MTCKVFASSLIREAFKSDARSTVLSIQLILPYFKDKCKDKHKDKHKDRHKDKHKDKHKKNTKTNKKTNTKKNTKTNTKTNTKKRRHSKQIQGAVLSIQLILPYLDNHLCWSNGQSFVPE